MILTVHGQKHGLKPVVNPSPERIATALKKLKLFGKYDAAVLDDEAVGYVQVAGGGAACMVELRRKDPTRHYRGFLKKPRRVFPDGTRMSFSGGDIPLRADEWVVIDEVIEVFVAFREQRPFPEWIDWRDMSEVLGIC